MQEIEIIRPDDWHLHLRDGPGLALTVNATARVFARAIVMPNLKPPVTTVAQARSYRERIVGSLDPAGKAAGFEPLMTLYLTDATEPAEITRARESDCVHAVKLYPAGATTNSESGVTSIEKVYAALERMQRLGMPLLVHGEMTDPAVDIFDREKAFIDAVLVPLMRDFPALRIVFEHITTADAVQFVSEGPPNLAATITPHHLLFNRNHMLVGGIRPHYYCLPVLKRSIHQDALVAAATSGSPRFFLGTDSAPHPRSAKECASGCAGIYSAHAAIEVYAEVFESQGALQRLEAFASLNGAAFYGLTKNPGRIRLRREPWQVPTEFLFDGDTLVPLRAGETVAWRVVETMC